jgi:hypothetical protein
MVKIEIDKDKFDERVERMIHNAIDHAFGLKLKPKPSDQQERKQIDALI